MTDIFFLLCKLALSEKAKITHTHTHTKQARGEALMEKREAQYQRLLLRPEKDHFLGSQARYIESKSENRP